MRLPELCIERPVLTTVMSVAIVLVGAIALERLPNRELPDVDPPMVTVTTVYLGAAPEVVETSVTQVLEDQLIGIEGIKHVTSVSREQVSQINVEFELVPRRRRRRRRRARPRRARAQHPAAGRRGAGDRQARAPTRGRSSGSRCTAAGSSQIELSTLAETRLRDRLAKLPGVAEVWLAGERRYAMRIWIDNTRLTGAGADDRRRRRGAAARERRHPVGPHRGQRPRVHRAHARRDEDRPRSTTTLILAETDSGPVRLRDVGRTEVGAEDDRKLVALQRQAGGRRSAS